MENILQFASAKAVRFGHNGSAAGTSAQVSLLIPQDLGSSQAYPQGTPLVMQGTPAREVFLVERGLIKLLHLGENGEEFIVGLRSTGSIIGAASVIVQEPFPFSAITTTWCKVRQIHAEMFIHLAKNDLQFCWNLHQMLGHEVHQQASQLFAFKNLSARQRFENLLRQFASTVTAQATSLARQVSLPLKHWEIAQLIGVTPEHLSRTIRQMQTEGILLKANGRLVISDVTKLYQASDLS